MYGLWTHQIVGQRGIGLLGRLPNLGAGHARLGQQLVVAADGLGVAGLFAHPDRQRRAPIALARQGPIDVCLEEIAEPPVADVLGQPVDPAVVGQHLFLEGGCADEPAFAGILDQRVLFRPPAERIIVHVLLLVEEHAFGLQLADDVAVAVFDPAALVLGNLRSEPAIWSNRAKKLGHTIHLVSGRHRRSIARRKSKSSSPNAGAIWTIPVPVSVVTKSPPKPATREAKDRASRFKLLDLFRVYSCSPCVKSLADGSSCGSPLRSSIADGRKCFPGKIGVSLGQKSFPQ